MVTVKRKINNETERYGGFSEIEVKAPAETFDVKVGSSFMEDQYRQAEAKVNYTKATPAPVQTAKPAKPTFQEPVLMPSPEELMPRVRYQRQEEEVEREAPVPRQKMDSRTKLILGVYVSIIALLSALVIATGIFLSSAGARVESLQSEVDSRNAIISQQLSDISMLSDENNITGRAYNNGMERVDSTEIIDLLPIGEAPTYEGTTNWFDSFCDWLSGVFGG
ncbi:MAG: hypothetical protein J1F36_02410 [Clostridiales bacterium]|nr:hypothetical protein [Clostridiales bacterium]